MMTSDEQFREWLTNELNGTESLPFVIEARRRAWHARDDEIAALNDTIAGLTAEVNEGGWMDKFNACCRRKKELHGIIRQLREQRRVLLEALEAQEKLIQVWDDCDDCDAICLSGQAETQIIYCDKHLTDVRQAGLQRRAALALCEKTGKV